MDQIDDRLAEVDRLEEGGDAVGALDALVALNRDHPSTELQHRLIALRHRAAEGFASQPRSPWPPVFDDPFPDVVGVIPEIPAAELTAEIMGATVAQHGSILVRGLFAPDQVERTRRSVEEAIAALLAPADRRDRGAYEPILGLTGMTKALRDRIEGGHGAWLGDSPAATAQVIDDLRRAGVIDAVAGHFGERPVISLQKSTLRRVQPEYRFTGWHQDGSFLGPETRAMNVWVALSPCGGDRPAPGLELIPGRISELFPADGGTGTASINGYAVHAAAQAQGLTATQPVFDPGDALLFDELMAHRTFLTETMTEPRLALECWFFAPSKPNEKYLSLLV